MAKNRISDMALARLMTAYMKEAKAAMISAAAKDPQYEEGAHYVEMLADSFVEKLHNGKDLSFKTKDLGL